MKGLLSRFYKILGSKEEREEMTAGVGCRLCFAEALAANGSAYSRCLRHRRVRYGVSRSG